MSRPNRHTTRPDDDHVVTFAFRRRRRGFDGFAAGNSDVSA
jgi:hypothetical protein